MNKTDFHDLEIQYLSVDDLKPYEKNARKHKNLDVDAIVKSIERFGFSDPIGIWSDENLIVEGHGRLMAAKKLGMKEVPCMRLDHLSDEERRAYALARNKTAELSEWDNDIKLSELKDITDIDMTQFGFEIIDDKVAVEDDFDPVPPEEPISKKGDIWLLGNHRVMCGDSTVYTDLAKLCNGREVDLYLTDPPYNVDYGEGERKILNDKMEDENFRTFLSDTFSNAKMCMKGGLRFIFGTPIPKGTTSGALVMTWGGRSENV